MKRSRKPSKPLSRVISCTVFGTLFFVTGVIGYRLDRKGVPMFSDSRWAETPILWQIGLGLVLLGAAAFFYRLLPDHLKIAPRQPRQPITSSIKHAGAGRSAAAQQQRQHMIQTGDESHRR